MMHKQKAFWVLLVVYGLVWFILKGVFVEFDSVSFYTLAQTRSLSYCTPVGYVVFLWLTVVPITSVVVQLVLRAIVVVLWVNGIQKKYNYSPKTVIGLYVGLHLDLLGWYYNYALMAESVLISLWLLQWVFWQQYQMSAKKSYLYGLGGLMVVGLWIKPIAVVSVLLLLGRGIYQKKKKFILVACFVYVIAFSSISTLYWLRFKTFQPDIFKGILAWNNAAFCTPELKKDQFKTQNPTWDSLLTQMYACPTQTFDFNRNDNNIFEDSSFVQQYIQKQTQQHQNYRIAIVEVNRNLGGLSKKIVRHYPKTYFTHYLVPNTKLWLTHVVYPHPLSYRIPNTVKEAFPQSYIQVYQPQKGIDGVHHSTKILVWISLGLSLGYVYVRKKAIPKEIYLGIAFMVVYLGVMIVAHPAEYRYIAPVTYMASMLASLLIASCTVTRPTPH